MNLTFTYKVHIKEQHLDTFGHVNNAVYLTLYEEARWEMITQRGYGLKVVQELKQGPVILEVKCRFVKEVRLRDTILIHTECSELTKAVSTLTQKMVRESDGALCSDAEFKFALWDTEKRKIIAPTAKWLEAIGVPTA